MVGASDYLPWVLWMKWFLEDQGYGLDSTYFFQDNESVIKRIRNWKRSSRQKTRHKNIRFFFITDVIKREDIKVKHSRSGMMIAFY